MLLSTKKGSVAVSILRVHTPLIVTTKNSGSIVVRKVNKTKPEHKSILYTSSEEEVGK